MEIVVPTEGAGLRLDRFLPKALEAKGETISRSALQQWIKDGAVLVDGARVKPRHALAEGNVISVDAPEPEPTEVLPEDIPVPIMFEDEDIVVVNKPSGLVVHPGSGNLSGTLVNALLHHCDGKLCELAGEDRPGIVHRLDKDTSGCLVAAKSETAYHSLVAQFSGRETGKEYLAVTSCLPVSEEGTITNRLGRSPRNRQQMTVLEEPAGKEAVTNYRVLRSDPGGKWASLSCIIHTGRTHQIRVHLKECLRAPILGDEIYGSKKAKVRVERLLLHAWKLRFRHPVSGEEVNFEASIPEDFLAFLPENSLWAKSE